MFPLITFSNLCSEPALGSRTTSSAWLLLVALRCLCVLVIIPACFRSWPMCMFCAGQVNAEVRFLMARLNFSNYYTKDDVSSS